MTKQKRFMKTNKLSVLLSLALDDLELVSKDYNYVINMDFWHAKEKGDKRCEVCLGGSVLAKTFKYPLENATLDDTCPRLLDKLHTINYIRRGNLVMALEYLKLNEEVKVVREIYDIVNYTDYDDEFNAVELILGEHKASFTAIEDCHDFKDFVTFYRRVASKLNMVGL